MGTVPACASMHDCPKGGHGRFRVPGTGVCYMYRISHALTGVFIPLWACVKVRLACDILLYRPRQAHNTELKQDEASTSLYCQARKRSMQMSLAAIL